MVENSDTELMRTHVLCMCYEVNAPGFQDMSSHEFSSFPDTTETIRC